MNDLYTILHRRRSGCWINGEYYGIIGYSDDILLLAPTLDALKEMLLACEDYAVEHNLQFSTDPNPKKSKTKMHGVHIKNKRGFETTCSVW